MNRDERFEAELVPQLRSLFGAAYRMTGNAHDAEDLVQETFLRAHRAFDRFEPGSNARAWLHTILRRVRTDMYRRTKLPGIPGRVGELSLVGARYCPLVGLSFAPHVYYASSTSHVSVFVVPHGLRLDDRFVGESRGRAVRLLRVEGETVGIVADSDADARAFEGALRPALAAWVASDGPGPWE